MSRPTCDGYPPGHGYYGKNRQFVRWKCMGGDGDRPHLIRPELSVRLDGVLEGACDHCERPWGPTDGLPQAVGDRLLTPLQTRLLGVPESAYATTRSRV